jgi:hypothetical protein
MIIDALLTFATLIFNALVGLFPSMPTTGLFVTFMTTLSTGLANMVAKLNYVGDVFPVLHAVLICFAIYGTVLTAIYTYKLTMYVYSHLTRSSVQY